VGIARALLAIACLAPTGERHSFWWRRATPEDVDAALYEFGMRWVLWRSAIWPGGCGLADSQGVPALEVPGSLSGSGGLLCEMGRYGQKTGAGWYRYDAANRKPSADPEVLTVIRKYAIGAGFHSV